MIISLQDATKNYQNQPHTTLLVCALITDEMAMALLPFMAKKNRIKGEKEEIEYSKRGEMHISSLQFLHIGRLKSSAWRQRLPCRYQHCPMGEDLLGVSGCFLDNNIVQCERNKVYIS